MAGNKLIIMTKNTKIIPANTEKLKVLGKKFGFTFDKEKLLKDHINGDIIFIRQKDNGQQFVYVLHEVYFQTISLNYSCNKNIKKGTELLISSFKLPKFKLK